MPTYDYRCRDCGHTIEIVHSILEDGPEACERCRGPVERVLHPTGVIFRGSGFYVTDSRSGSGSGGGSGGGSSDGDGGPGGSTSSAGTKDAGAKDAGAKGSPAKETGSKGSGTPTGGED